LTLATLSTAEDQLDPALRDLLPVAKDLKPGLDALRRFAGDATPALRKLTPAVADLEPLAAALDPAVRHIQLASERLRPQVPQVEEMTRMIVKCETPIANFFQWTPSILKFGDANGANPRADVSIGLDTLDAKLGDPSLRRPYRCTDDFKQEDAG
jgi:ABC-type transporter Mla subunit MlaD